MNIKLSEKDKIRIQCADDIFGIMQRILLRDNKIDQEKEHFWIIGLNQAGYILYIELVSLGSTSQSIVEPMNVFRVAILKNATSVIAIHNHPGGTLKPSDEDKDLTDRLIQVGKIIAINVLDHLIITPKSYMSFADIGLMQELEQSLKYVPTFQIIEKIRKEEKGIAREAVNAVKAIAKAEREEKEQILLSAVNFLLEKQMDRDQIAKILGVTSKQIEKVLKKKS